MSERIWRRIIELSSLVSLFLAILAMPNGDGRSFVLGVAIAGFVLVLVMEWKLVETESVLERVITQKDRKYAELLEQHKKLAVYDDPELLAIFREDEREKLRITRDATESQNKTMEALRRQFVDLP